MRRRLYLLLSIYHEWKEARIHLALARIGVRQIVSVHPLRTVVTTEYLANPAAFQKHKRLRKHLHDVSPWTQEAARKTLGLNGVAEPLNQILQS